MRRSPLLPQLRAAGAAVGEAAGWDRAAWFEPGAGAEPLWIYDFDRPSWFGPVGEEMRATRERVALFDLSTYAKFLVQGPEAVAGLQRLCTSNVDVAIGRVVYTLLCNERGGIEMDPTVTRLDEDRFLVLAPTLYQRRTEMLLRNGLPPGATVTDVTSGYATLHVAGPTAARCSARAHGSGSLERGVPVPVGARDRPRVGEGDSRCGCRSPASSDGSCSCRRSSPPTSTTRSSPPARPHGMRHAGAFAFDGLRLERGFRSWGHDIGVLDDPYAVGLGFAVRSDKEDFVGKQALAALKDAPRERRARERQARGSGPDAVARRAGRDRQGAARAT